MRPVLVVFLLAQLVLLGIELGTQYDTAGRQFALALTNIIAVAGVLWLDHWARRQGKKLSTLTIVVIAGSVWLDALGNFQGFYGQYWWYDRVTHAVGGLAASALFIDFFLIRRQAIPWATAAWLGFFVGQFAASMYEVSEWIGDEVFETARVRGPFDAPRDLLNNAIGGLLAVAGFWLLKGKK